MTSLPELRLRVAEAEASQLISRNELRVLLDAIEASLKLVREHAPLFPLPALREWERVVTKLSEM